MYWRTPGRSSISSIPPALVPAGGGEGVDVNEQGDEIVQTSSDAMLHEQGSLNKSYYTIASY